MSNLASIKSPTSRLIAVTGASGFVGSHLVTALRARGTQVRVIARSVEYDPPPGVESAVAALDDPHALGAAVDGAYAVVHLAGRAHVMREASPEHSAREFQRHNVDTTRAVCDAARRARVTRVVYLSSLGAVTTTSASVVTDWTTAHPDSLYGRSKLAAEAVVRALAGSDGPEHVILRPPMIFGEGMKGNPLRLYRAVARGVPMPLGRIQNRRSLMYVGNLVSAIVTAVEMRGAIRDTFVIGDSQPLSSGDLVREIAASLGARARVVPVPVWSLRAAGRVGDIMARVLPIPLTSDAVSRLTGSLAVDFTRFCRETGYMPLIAHQHALAVTAEWFKRLSA